MVMRIDEDKKMVSFRGEVRWASIPPNPPRSVSDDYKKDENRDDMNYSIEVECSESEFKKLKKYKLPKLVELKEDDESGKNYLRLKAAKVKTNLNKSKNNGENFFFDDISVIHKNGEPVDVALANGSKALVKAKLIEVKNGHTLRLIGVMVTDLIEYKKDNIFEDDIEEDEEENDAENHNQQLQGEDEDIDEEFGI